MGDNYLDKKELQELNELIILAKAMTKRSYAPYSNFKVGAALRGKSGKVYTGCNVENAAYSPSICAERVAFAKAVSEGERRFKAIAVCGAPEGQVPDKLCAPCGVCRQVLSEFVEDDFKVIMFDEEKGVRAYPFKKILPYRFDLNEY